ncbi:MAG: glutamate--tRNA ligase [Pseudomonadota bacterium]
MSVRTRIAPSPTGDPHVGTAYMALFNWAFAKSQGGEFLLRIEDTDQARSTQQSEQAILDALTWLGLSWDEGPDNGGAHGPYRQSERRDIYDAHIQKLLDDGNAFHCFCTKERLDELRAQQQAAKQTTGYDGLCMGLSTEEVAQRKEAGEPYVIRLKVPRQGDCVFHDRLRGEISIPFEQVDMQVLIKADGMPTYHFAVVVDDHLMGITHILRGEEWINSVPKHILLYEYFGWQKPEFVHLPLLRNPDQSKLSKRKNPTSVTYYRDEGFLAPALLNYLALMGYSMPDEREIFSLQDMVEAFDPDRISVRGPVFDIEKLAWMNGQYIRKLNVEEFADVVSSWMSKDDRLQTLIPLVQERTEKLSDLIPAVGYLLGARRTLSEEDFLHKKLDRDAAVLVLHHSLAAFDALRQWDGETLMQTCQTLAGAMDMKFRDFLYPLFIAISGQAVSLPLFDSMAFLGADLSRARLRDALSVFSVSGKEKKRLDKAYTALDLDLVQKS